MSKRKPRITVIGDSMLDAYIFTQHSGSSPEADVPLLRQLGTDYRPGGAANVAMNLNAMQVKPRIISMIGNDDAGERLRKLLKINNISHNLLVDLERQTSKKSRFVNTEFKQFFRLDDENEKQISRSQEKDLIDILDRWLLKTKTDAVILQDYNKGLLTKRVIRKVQKCCSSEDIPLLVDPKHNNFELLSKCSLFKPNLKESLHYLDSGKMSVKKVYEGITTKLKNCDKLVLTMGSKGLYYSDSKKSGAIAAHKLADPDVSGAGDAVIAALGVFLLQGMPLSRMAELANIAGYLSCREKGVSAVSIDDILEYSRKNSPAD